MTNLLTTPDLILQGRRYLCKAIDTNVWTEYFVVGEMGPLPYVTVDPVNKINDQKFVELFDRVLPVGIRGGMPRLGIESTLHKFKFKKAEPTPDQITQLVIRGAI